MSFSTPPEVAERLGVEPAKVRGWIERGELKASNLAGGTAGRPRWKIAEADLQAFLDQRSNRKPAKAPRRKQQEVVKSFV